MKRGFSLIEVIFSILLFAVAIIPVFMLGLNYRKGVTTQQITSEAIQAAQYRAEFYRQSDITALPSSGTESADVVISSRTYTVFTDFCTRPSYCTEFTKDFLFRVHYDGVQRYIMEAVFAKPEYDVDISPSPELSPSPSISQEPSPSASITWTVPPSYTPTPTYTPTPYYCLDNMPKRVAGDGPGECCPEDLSPSYRCDGGAWPVIQGRYCPGDEPGDGVDPDEPCDSDSDSESESESECAAGTVMCEGECVSSSFCCNGTIDTDYDGNCESDSYT